MPRPNSLQGRGRAFLDVQASAGHTTRVFEKVLRQFRVSKQQRLQLQLPRLQPLFLSQLHLAEADCALHSAFLLLHLFHLAARKLWACLQF